MQQECSRPSGYAPIQGTPLLWLRGIVGMVNGFSFAAKLLSFIPLFVLFLLHTQLIVSTVL